MINASLVQEIRANCATCKEVEKQYKNLIEKGLDKETAKETIKAVKSQIKTEKESNKSERDFVKNWFADFEKVGKSLLIGICKEEQIRFAEIANKFERVADFISEYTTKASVLGEPIRKTKEGYKFRKVTAQNVRALLRECVCNYVSVQNGFPVNFVRIESANIISE